MINKVKSGDYVRFYNPKPHEVHTVISKDKKNSTLTIKCNHCNMIIHGIPYFLLEIIEKPKYIRQSNFKAIY